MKKFLKYTLVILLVLAVAFFSIGLFIPSYTFDNSIEVNKSPEQAFSAFYNLGNMSKWIPGFQYIEPLEGFPDEVGSKLKMVLEQDGKKYEMIETMTAFKTNELFAFTLTNDVMDNEVEIVFIKSGDKTKIVAHNVVKGKNVLWRSLLFLSKGKIEKMQQDSYNKLKEVIEGS